MDKPYVPISCATHDELLEHATLRRECELTVASRDESTERIRGFIVDVYSRDGAEYLKLRDGATYRLDRIQAVNGRSVQPASWETANRGPGKRPE